MSYYAKGHVAADDDVDDCGEFDPTPYGGGYDQSLTYGRALPPSDDICYQPSSSYGGGGGGYDYRRPQYSSYAQQSDYGSAHVVSHQHHGYGGYGGQSEGYGGRPSYMRKNEDDVDDYNNPRRYGVGGDDDRRPYGGDEGYGRQKYGGDVLDDDNENRRNMHHNRRHYYE